MAIRAGQILHLGGDTVLIDRLQSAGLGDINVGSDTIRETGNYLNVEKVLQDPDLSFSMESFDVSTEVEALLTGDSSGGVGDPAGTAYTLSDMGSVHITSPWKDETTGSAGTIDAGVLIPNYFVTRASYRFGVDENAGETFELAGSEAYMAQFNPVNEIQVASAGQTTFVTAAPAVRHRVGGFSSNEFKYVMGVITDTTQQTAGTSNDYVVTTATTTEAEVATVEFNDPPGAGVEVHIAYFDATTLPSFPQTIHPAATTKPGAVRGRDIKVYAHIPSGGAEASGRVEIKCVQAVSVEGAKTTELERCMGELLPVGRTVTEQDVTGDLGYRAADSDQIFQFLRQITGVASGESIGVLNSFPVGLEIEILDPTDRTVTLKTIWVEDAKFQIPATPAQAGSVVDFTLNWESNGGELTVYKGAKP